MKRDMKHNNRHTTARITEGCKMSRFIWIHFKQQLFCWIAILVFHSLYSSTPAEGIMFVAVFYLLIGYSCGGEWSQYHSGAMPLTPPRIAMMYASHILCTIITLICVVTGLHIHYALQASTIINTGGMPLLGNTGVFIICQQAFITICFGYCFGNIQIKNNQTAGTLTNILVFVLMVFVYISGKSGAISSIPLALSAVVLTEIIAHYRHVKPSTRSAMILITTAVFAVSLFQTTRDVVNSPNNGLDKWEPPRDIPVPMAPPMAPKQQPHQPPQMIPKQTPHPEELR